MLVIATTSFFISDSLESKPVATEDMWAPVYYKISILSRNKTDQMSVLYKLADWLSFGSKCITDRLVHASGVGCCVDKWERRKLALSQHVS
jgi:hypothetical protein